MSILKIYEGKDGVFENLDDAIQYMREANFENEVSVYDIDSNKAYEKTQKIYDVIKEYNKGKPLNIQILPTNPSSFRGILGCLGVQVYSIGLGTFSETNQLLSSQEWTQCHKWYIIGYLTADEICALKKLRKLHIYDSDIYEKELNKIISL